MITITIRKTSTDYLGFGCIGHAGWNRRGKDIVCAAASILVINTVNSLQELADTPLHVVTNESAGLLDCRIKDIPNEKSNLLIDAMVLGLLGIEKEYGKKYITLKFEEV